MTVSFSRVDGIAIGVLDEVLLSTVTAGDLRRTNLEDEKL
jgi:hypothetical protein